MHQIEGVVQNYPWGSRTFLPELLNSSPDGRPWAELWLGTHPNGPARLGDRRLEEVTGPLPYLLKVLAADEPLSMQAHPSSAQAIEGFAAGRYPDDRPKPELLVALTPVTALCGVRPPAATAALLRDIGATELADEVDRAGPGPVLHDIYNGRFPLGPTLAACDTSTRNEAKWVTALAERYPGDPSVVATLLLNMVSLKPGEAIFLGPGNLHAYLNGAGVELMGASDNVVRGGLTTKPVDVEGLLAVVDTTPLENPVRPVADVYELDDTAIRLHRIVGPGSHRSRGHELAITTAGATLYPEPGSQLDVPEDVTAFVASG